MDDHANQNHVEEFGRFREPSEEEELNSIMGSLYPELYEGFIDKLEMDAILDDLLDAPDSQLRQRMIILREILRRDDLPLTLLTFQSRAHMAP